MIGPSGPKIIIIVIMVIIKVNIEPNEHDGGQSSPKTCRLELKM